MFRPSEFRDLVSGRRQGPAASLARGLLRAVEGPYTWAVRRRNRRYDTGAAPIHRVDVPVVSIGNLTLGGTGKTPLVEWVARWFQQQGVAVAVISRGYGAKPGQPNDEALELALKLPGVPHLQNPDRVTAAREAIEYHGAEAIVLDDAMQHRRLHRDLNIVLLDALEPFGFGHVFPRGTLREPIEGLSRADVLVLSRADILDQPARDAFWAKIARYAPGAIRAEAAHAPRRLVATPQSPAMQNLVGPPACREAPLDLLTGRRVAAFCGIGNPAAFEHTLRSCGYEVADFRVYPDHHPFGPADVASLTQWAQPQDVEAVVCTQKDLVKLGVERLGQTPLWAVAISLKLLSGRELLEQRLAALLSR